MVFVRFLSSFYSYLEAVRSSVPYCFLPFFFKVRHWCAHNIFVFASKPDFATRTSFLAARSSLPLFSVHCLSLTCLFLFSTRCLLLSSFCLLLLTRYTVLTELVTARMSLTAYSSTLFSGCCCSLYAIHRSCSHSLFPADSHRLRIATQRSLYPACCLLLATRYSLFLSCFSLLGHFSRSSPLAACCSLKPNYLETVRYSQTQ